MSWQQKRACKKRDLLSLIGKLAHACKVVPPGRTFLRRMIDTSTKDRDPNHWIRLNKEFRSDLAWWVQFLQNWNGRSMMEVHNPNWHPDVEFSSDASGSWGCGAVWEDRWLQLAWHGTWSDVYIATKELLPIVLACAVWGPHWQHKCVQVYCDNMAVVNILYTQTSKDARIMHLLRCLHFFCASYDLRLRASHIKGVLNTAADAISRNLPQVFSQVCPGANKSPTPTPPQLWSLLVTSQPDWLSPTWRQLLDTSLKAAWRTAHEELTNQHRPPTLPSASGSTSTQYQRKSST